MTNGVIDGEMCFALNAIFSTIAFSKFIHSRLAIRRLIPFSVVLTVTLNIFVPIVSDIGSITLFTLVDSAVFHLRMLVKRGQW
jgi:hypothetical protein